MKAVDDIRILIAECLSRDEPIDETEIARLPQKLHPETPLNELIATVVAESLEGRPALRGPARLPKQPYISRTHARTIVSWDPSAPDTPT